jgi:1-phosphatidylinositol-4-phosphate 5-kinase
MYKWKNAGKSKVLWPPGAPYEGDSKARFMHGFHIYTGVDGYTYKGYWEMNEKHRHGQKY